MMSNLRLRGSAAASSASSSSFFSMSQNHLSTPMNTNTSNISPSAANASSWIPALNRRGGTGTGSSQTPNQHKNDHDNNANDNPEMEHGIDTKSTGQPLIEDELGDILGDEFTSSRWRQAAGTTNRDMPVSNAVGGNESKAKSTTTAASSSSTWVPGMYLRSAATSFQQSRDKTEPSNNKARLSPPRNSSSASSWVSSFSRRSSAGPSAKQNTLAGAAASNSSPNGNKRQQQAQSPASKAKPKTNTATEFCHVCGSRVCALHSKKSSATSGKRMLFCMCIDCSLDLHSLEHNLNPHHPELAKTLQRLMYYYTRMMLHLSFCLPRLQEVGYHLTQTEQRHSQISLGTSGLGFVGAALGVAGTAAMCK